MEWIALRLNVQNVTLKKTTEDTDIERVLMYFNPLPLSDAVRKQKKKYFIGFFQFKMVTIRKISPLWKPEIYLFTPFLELKIE